MCGSNYQHVSHAPWGPVLPPVVPAGALRIRFRKGHVPGCSAKTHQEVAQTLKDRRQVVPPEADAHMPVAVLERAASYRRGLEAALRDAGLVVTDADAAPGYQGNPAPYLGWSQESTVGEGLTTCGGQTLLNIDVYDWQGRQSHNPPVIECPGLYPGVGNPDWIVATHRHSSNIYLPGFLTFVSC